jgi:uncharacterized protein YegP (UPF0339 family)
VVLWRSLACEQLRQFELLIQARGDDFRFRIKDEDGGILAITKKGYEKKDEILKVIEQSKKGAATAKIDDQSTKSRCKGCFNKKSSRRGKRISPRRLPRYVTRA